MAATIALTPGANTVLPPGPWVVSVAGPYDVAALVLGADDQVASDTDLVFHGQPATRGVRLHGSRVDVDPDALRSGAHRVVVVVSSEDGATPLGRLAPPELVVSSGNGPVARFAAAGLTVQTAVLLAELYRHGPSWKLRAVGAGWADGLAGLVRDFGVVVDEEPGDAQALAVTRARVLELTNQERAVRGLPALVADRLLTAAAQGHDDDMVARGFFAHESPDGSSVADRVGATGYAYAVVAENIAAGQRSPEEVVQGWMDSPGHRRNLLHPDVRELGVGFADGGAYGTMWTQVFGRRR